MRAAELHGHPGLGSSAPDAGPRPSRTRTLPASAAPHHSKPCARSAFSPHPALPCPCPRHPAFSSRRARVCHSSLPCSPGSVLALAALSSHALPQITEGLSLLVEPVPPPPCCLSQPPPPLPLPHRPPPAHCWRVAAGGAPGALPLPPKGSGARGAAGALGRGAGLRPPPGPFRLRLAAGCADAAGSMVWPRPQQVHKHKCTVIPSPAAVPHYADHTGRARAAPAEREAQTRDRPRG
jgi:hypothetical protein